MKCSRVLSAAHPIALLVIVSLLLGCISARVSQAQGTNPPPLTPPSEILIGDIELDAAQVHGDTGGLPQGPVRSQLHRGDKKDPEERARQIVDMLSDRIVKDLRAKGLQARRLQPGEVMPQEGWLVRGVFTDVGEGNHLRRAVVGFGQGEADVQLVISVDDLRAGVPKPLYELDASATSGKMPGAAVTLNPYVAAAKIVMSRKDPDKSIRKAADEISNEIAKRVAVANGSGVTEHGR